MAEFFDPHSLFENGVKGAWYDPLDKTTMWQDAAGTIPVENDGDPVGRIEDKSGNGHHLIQDDESRRPIYKESSPYAWLEFDGLSTALYETQAWMWDLASVSVYARLRGPAQNDRRIICEGSSQDDRPIYSILQSSSISPYNHTTAYIRGNGTGSNLYSQANDGVCFDNTDRVVSVADSGLSLNFRVDKSETANKTYSNGTLTMDRFCLGAVLRANFVSHFQGRIYQLIIAEGILNLADKLEVEQYLTQLALSTKFLSGSISENLAVDEWHVSAYLIPDMSVTRSIVTPESEFELLVPFAREGYAHYVTVAPYMGTIWTAENPVIVGQKCFPTAPETTPYYYRCTIAGTTGITEPDWLTSPAGALIDDNDAQWELVERIVQPITHGPLIPQ